MALKPAQSAVFVIVPKVPTRKPEAHDVRFCSLRRMHVKFCQPSVKQPAALINIGQGDEAEAARGAPYGFRCDVTDLRIGSRENASRRHSLP